MNKAVLYPALGTGLATLTVCSLCAFFKMIDHKDTLPPSLPQSLEQVKSQTSSGSEPTSPQVIKGTTFIPK